MERCFKDVTGVDAGASEQEFVDESFYLGILALGEHAVHVTAVDGVAHAVGDTWVQATGQRH